MRSWIGKGWKLTTVLSNTGKGVVQGMGSRFKSAKLKQRTVRLLCPLYEELTYLGVTNRKQLERDLCSSLGVLCFFLIPSDERDDSISSAQSSQSCLTLCDPINCSTPGLPVQLLDQLPESTQTNVHWVGDAIQPSHPLSSPSPPAFNFSQHQGLLKWVSS